MNLKNYSSQRKVKGSSEVLERPQLVICQTKDNIDYKHLPVRVGGTYASCPCHALRHSRHS